MREKKALSYVSIRIGKSPHRLPVVHKGCHQLAGFRIEAFGESTCATYATPASANLRLRDGDGESKPFTHLGLDPTIAARVSIVWRAPSFKYLLLNYGLL